MIEWFEEVVSSFWKFGSIGRTNFSFAEAISTIEVFNFLLAEIPRYQQIFLKFCHIHSVKSVLILFTLRATFFASILAEIKEINFKYGQASRQWKLSTTKCRSPYTESWVVDPMSKLLLFVYNKSHVTLHLKSNAESVNSPF